MEGLVTKKRHKKFDVNEIKKDLLSRKLEHKISAAKRLFKFLMKNHSEEFRIKLINADVVEMLCEASCTTNVILLKYVFKCIFVFIECSQFFQQNHTTYTLESIIRALYILLKTFSADSILILGLELVSDIIFRLNQQKIAVNTICNIPNIMNLLSKLFDSENSKQKVYAGSEVIISLLHSQGIQKFKKIMEDAVIESLKILVEIAKKSKGKKSLIIVSEVVNGSMRFLVHPKIEATSEISKSSLFLQLFLIMKEILVPFLIENKDKLHKNDLGMAQIILSALLSIYHYPEEPITIEFSHFLASKGFIDFLPSFEAQWNIAELVIVIRSLLFELLQCLSNNILGRENWRNLLLPGFEVLPRGSSYNSTILFHEANDVVPIASIVYSYFYLLSSSNPTITPEYFQSLSHYILSLIGMPSASVTKALWFIFAVAYLSKRDESHNSKMAMSILVNFIMHYNVGEVYTHHPAILYWAFSDEYVCNELQAKIIKQWLDEDDDGSIEDLKLLLTVNKQSCFVLMGLMACDNKSSLTIHNILTSIILNTKGETGYIFDYAWFILPQYLAQFSSHSDTLQYECLVNVMKFCYTSKSKNSDISQVLRISCLLPAAFIKYFKMSFSLNPDGKLTVDDYHAGIMQSTFSLVDNLINISLKINDKRVPAVYLTHDAFLNTMESLLASDSDLTNASLMKLLTSLIKCQKLANQKSSQTIHLDVMRIVQFLCRHPTLCIATLKFLALYLEIILSKAVLSLVDIPVPDFIQLRTLYVQIHMVCAKSESEASVYSWICLKRLLELSDGLGHREHLAGIPYTTSLLMKSVDTEAWKEAVSFIPVWLPSLPKYSSRSLATPSSVIAVTTFIEKLRKKSRDPEIINKLSKILNYSKIEKIKEEKLKIEGTSK